MARTTENIHIRLRRPAYEHLRTLTRATRMTYSDVVELLIERTTPDELNRLWTDREERSHESRTAHRAG